MKMYVYVMTHTANNGKVTTLEVTLGGDADARYAGKLFVERYGGAVSIPLQDGITFIFP